MHIRAKFCHEHGIDTDASLCQIDNLGTILIESNGEPSALGGQESYVVIVVVLVDDGATSFPLDTLSLDDWSGVPLLTLETKELAGFFQGKGVDVAFFERYRTRGSWDDEEGFESS